MFKKLFDELLAAKTEEEINLVLYRNGGTNRKADGVDAAFQHETLSWQDHERLFSLAERLTSSLK